MPRDRLPSGRLDDKVTMIGHLAKRMAAPIKAITDFAQ
jgi:hypothetical protein